MLMPGGIYDILVWLCYSLYIIYHVCIIGMPQVLRRSENTSCDRINGANYRERYIQFGVHVSEWKHILFKRIVTCMRTNTFKCMMASQDNKVFCIAAKDVIHLYEHIFFGFVRTVRFNTWFIVRMKPPLAVKKNGNNTRPQ